MYYEYKIIQYAFFIDFQQVYYKIDKNKMYQVLDYLGILTKLNSLIKMALENTKNDEIIWGGYKLREFGVNRGLR